MIAYLDTSAMVPLIISEPTSGDARVLWDAATRVVSVRLLYPEARAALAQAHRGGRITRRQLRRAVEALDERVAEIDVIEIDAHLAREAGDLAEVHGLRGYDAVHLAGAQRVTGHDDDEVVVVAGDRALLTAASAIGLATAALG